jgi:ankyrin repeat protein
MEVPDLVYWAMARNLEQMKKALVSNPDIDIADEGYTALHSAAENDQLEIVQFLLEHGANPSLRDWSGNTPTDYAKRNGSSAIVQLLGENVDRSTMQA